MRRYWLSTTTCWASPPPPPNHLPGQALALDEKPRRGAGAGFRQRTSVTRNRPTPVPAAAPRAGCHPTRHGQGFLTRPGAAQPAPLLNDQGPAGPLVFWGTAAHRYGQPSYTGKSPAATTIVCTPWHARSAGLSRGLFSNDLFTHGHPNLPADCVQGAHRECARRLHHLQPALHAARAARGRARCGGRPGVLAERCKAAAGAMRSAWPIFRRCRITNFWPTRSGRNTPTGATRCMTTATTATPCCRSSPSRITKTTISPSGGRSGAACCIAFCSRRATTCQCMRCACTWGCRNRTASSGCSACAI